ncbi:hypothetical protein HYE68_004169 [Fusarium pseudograminearum]|nr:hypothetical protein HYE68_004169 [Fusarium pseudograminearum]
MPSAKVFTAILAAMAVPMANAGNCKPKPVTTTDVALPGVTASGTVTAITSGTETGTPTTETSAATTTEAACSKYTPYELQPADCGKKGVAPNCGDKIIGTPSTCVDWTECGNTCGKTLGCKSFSVKGRTCTLYKTVVGELGWTASEGAGSSEFYDLELCFTCAEDADECATKCADYVNEENAGEVCNTFSYQVESGLCQLYADSLTCGQQGKVSCRSSQKLGQPVWTASADKCGKICGTTEGCKTFSFKYNGSKCQLYSAALDQLTFTPCNTGVKFYDLEKCYTCQNEVTPPPPATCSKYVSDPNCSSNTYCGTRGSICEEVLIPNVGDASCLENCAKSCIEYGAECVYFSYKPTTPWGSAKCKLYKSGKIIKNKNSIIKFYQQPCFKCQNPPAL